MRKIGSSIFAAALLMIGCQDFDYGLTPAKVDENVVNNANKVFGVQYNESQEWNTVNTGTVAITADADLDDVAKVQILTESPFFNAHARVLAEADAAKGETVTLTYDAPTANTRLIAACVSGEGAYYVKGFDVGATEVAFGQSGTTRAASADAASATYPDVAKLKMEYKYSTPSYNSRRTVAANEAAASDDASLKNWASSNSINLWEGKHWESERLWGTRSGGSVDAGNGWSFVNNTVVREVADIDADEAANLKDIFDNYLGRKSVNRMVQDNMESVRNSGVVKMNNNHLVSNGTRPITITPVLMASNEMSKCHLYYYYYNPSNIPSGMTEEEYLKALPKFKAIQSWHTMTAAGISQYGSEQFFKKHEYLLPYYGEPEVFMNATSKMPVMCTNEGVFRIRNGQQQNGKDYFLVFKGVNSEGAVETAYATDDPNYLNQLWQVFTTPNGDKLIYSVGGQTFLVRASYNDYSSTYSTDIETAKSCAWRFDGHYIIRANNGSRYLGTDLGKGNTGVWTNKGKGDGDRSLWYLEAYTGSHDFTIRTDVEFSQTNFAKTAESNIIPAGYRIGFMLRKLAGSQNETDRSILTAPNNGCCYGDGRLNTEINQFPGHFGSVNSKYSMAIDDPRVAMFETNGKAYLTFEDGSDCNFSDLIIELEGGFDSFGDTPDVLGQVYTFCFEDRELGDYDMNDVVVKAVRLDPTHVVYSLEACGGTDEVYLRNLNGRVLNERRELHSIFNAHGIVNVSGSNHIKAVQELFTVEPSFSFRDLEKQIYIYNATTGREIRLSEVGEDPHALMIANDFLYPTEGTCIKTAYPAFLNWLQDRTQSVDWYTLPDNERAIYHQSAFELDEESMGAE